MTVNRLAADYIERHAIPHKKLSSLKQDRQMLKELRAATELFGDAMSKLVQ